MSGPILCTLFVTIGLFIMADVRPRDVTDELRKPFEHSVSRRKRIRHITGRKPSFSQRMMEEAVVMLDASGMGEQFATYRNMAALLSMAGVMFGIVIDNLLVSAVLGVGLAMTPLTIIRMSEYRRSRYETDFARLGIAITPQDYVSGKIARSLMLALLGLAFIPLGIPWLTVLTGITGILAYFQSDQKLRREIEKLNQAINAELPRMVGTMECTLGDSRDLIGFWLETSLQLQPLPPGRRKGHGPGAGRAADRPSDRQSGNGSAPHGGARAVQQPFRAHHDPAGRGSGR